MNEDKFNIKKGRPSDVIRLDVHNWYGELMHRIRGKTNDPLVGVAIIDTVKDLFGLTEEQIKAIHESNLDLDLKNQKNIVFGQKQYL